jgi:hypothetical protein
METQECEYCTQQILPTFVIRNSRAITRTRTDYDGKEAHLDSVRLTHGIRATTRNELGNSGLRGPVTSESPMRELVCCIQGFCRLGQL